MDARFRIRPATDADVPAIAALERASFSDPWTEDGFRSLLSGHALVAEAGAELVGYGFARHAADVGEILNVAVAPAARRQGIARALVAGLLEALHAVGVAEVFLEVRESNDPARILYEALGFAPVGRRPRYYRKPLEDALILLRRLERPWSASGADGTG